jgi:CPA2 family monovalent cation:H+ antiporter-2
VNPELQLIFNVTVALTIALAGGLLANALRQSPIIGYLVAGVLIGPFTPGFVGDREKIASVAEVGVIFLMFALGVAFSLKELARIKGVAIGGAIGQAIFTVLVRRRLGNSAGLAADAKHFLRRRYCGQQLDGHSQDVDEPR